MTITFYKTNQRINRPLSAWKWTVESRRRWFYHRHQHLHHPRSKIKPQRLRRHRLQANGTIAATYPRLASVSCAENTSVTSTICACIWKRTWKHITPAGPARTYPVRATLFANTCPTGIPTSTTHVNTSETIITTTPTIIYDVAYYLVLNGWYDMLWYCGVTFLFYFQDCSIRASPPLSWRRPSRGTCAPRHTQDWIPRARASAMRRALVCRWLDRTQPILKSRWYCYTTFVASRMYCDMLLIWNYRLLKVCLKFKLCFSEFSPKQNGVVRLLTRLFDFSCSENVSNRGFWTTNEWSRSQKVFFKLIQTIIHVLFIFLNFFSWWFLSSSQWSQKLRKKTLKFLLQT